MPRPALVFSAIGLYCIVLPVVYYRTQEQPQALRRLLTQDYSITMLAIGDWGATRHAIDKAPSSCCKIYRPTKDADFWSQRNIATLMGMTAATIQPKPQVVIGHGDNFYWNGVGKDDVNDRFRDTFERIYSHEGLKDIKWVNVAGNHDIGGSYFLCGTADWNFRPCTSTEEMLEGLNSRFDLQSKYKSPNGDRWKMPGHYYKHTIQGSDGLTIDVLNVDTNYADSHGAKQVCCQCFGYKQLNKWDGNCNDVNRGHEMCANGNVERFDACMSEIQKWWTQSLQGMKRDVETSTADYIIVNSHYSPHFHMGEPKRNQWYDILRSGRVRLWMNGHTHGENHDYGEFGTHFIENGAGGGIQSQASGTPPGHVKELKNIWVGSNDPYGFFTLKATRSFLRVEFVTFDDKWKFSKDYEATEIGGSHVRHCWLIPKDKGQGQRCS